jgi:hypothetical protein
VNDRLNNLIKKLERGIHKTLDFFNALETEQWELPIYDTPDSWLYRDLVAHFAYSEESMLEMAQDIASGGGGFSKDFDLDSFNAKMISELRQIERKELLTTLEEVRDTTIDWVQGLNVELLDHMGWHPIIGDISVEGLINLIYAHQLIHMREITTAPTGK